MKLNPETAAAVNDILSLALAGMPRPAGKEDWQYRDIPQVREDFFAQLVALIGEDNIQWITFAQYRHPDAVYKRGQFWISPAGLENIRNRPANSFAGEAA